MRGVTARFWESERSNKPTALTGLDHCDMLEGVDYYKDKTQKYLRNAVISEFVAHHPYDVSLEEIGELFGVSKQMVNLICKANALKHGLQLPPKPNAVQNSERLVEREKLLSREYHSKRCRERIGGPGRPRKVRNEV